MLGLGLSPSLLDLLQSYLARRMQWVNLSGDYSDAMEVEDGVPQGSVLGSTLFICYINDITNSEFEGGVCQYADDTALYCVEKDLDRLEHVMNTNLEKLKNWAVVNRLTINVNKTKYLLFKRSLKTPTRPLNLHIGHIRLGACTQYDYLGFRLDTTLSFKLHVQNIVANCNARIVSLCKIRKYINTETAIRIYKGIIMAKLQYGLVFALNALQSDQKKLQVIQNRALRVCTLSGRYATNLSLHITHNVLPIALRIKLDLLVLIFKKVKSHARQPEESLNVEPMGPGVITRSRSAPTLRITQPASSRFRNSLILYWPYYLGDLTTSNQTNK